MELEELSTRRFVDLIEPNAPLSAYFSEVKMNQINWKRLQRHCWAITAQQLCYAHTRSLFQYIQMASARDIEALDDSNPLVKLLAFAQVSWLIIELIVRTTRSLPSSQLEIAGLAFSASSLITYVILWDRPRSVTRGYEISAQRRSTNG